MVVQGQRWWTRSGGGGGGGDIPGILDQQGSIKRPKAGHTLCIKCSFAIRRISQTIRGKAITLSFIHGASVGHAIDDQITVMQMIHY